VPVAFVDTAGCGYQEQAGEEGTSLSNPEEGALLFRHLRSTLGESDFPFSIAIISPYRAQVEWLKQEALAFGLTEPGVVVNTIDSFQGQERDVVYLSLVRSNSEGDIGFLTDYRRMNVAMTRARKKLVIIGDSATLGADRFYERMLAYCEQNGFYTSAWEWMPV
ncbi:MAG: C-terminal helicase domain-containing protein, partial [Flavobacteriales bacterium]|nr:C-terminal helicase domain-containing protein [Flavobacteriales bacterium]